MSNSHYSIMISWSEADQGFLADVPDLKYCTAFGQTAREALDEVERAMAAWLRAAKQENKTIPSPRAGFEPGEM